MHPCRCNSSQLSDQKHGPMEGMKNICPVLLPASGESFSFHFVPSGCNDKVKTMFNIIEYDIKTTILYNWSFDI